MRPAWLAGFEPLFLNSDRSGMLEPSGRFGFICKGNPATA
jgi:hypothetical protein